MARGGKRPGAGRPKGQRNAATKEQIANISDMAKMHSDAAIATLVEIATNGAASEGARVSAANAILDRAWGKPLQGVDHTSSDGSMAPVTGFDVRIAVAPASDSDEAAG